jgi:Tfp pilus assembly protein PilF
VSRAEPSNSWLRPQIKGRLCLVLLLIMGLLWGCASPVARAPTAPSAPPPAPPPPPAPSARRVPPARPPQATPAMVASAQWVQEGIRALEAGDYNRATTLLERAISVEPNNGQAFYYYGLAMGEAGDPRAAVNLLRKAEILLRGDARALSDVYAQMGVNAERLGRRQEAMQRYEQALAQNPEHALARRRLQALKEAGG